MSGGGHAGGGEDERHRTRRAWTHMVARGGRRRLRGISRVVQRGLRRITEAPLIHGNAAELLVDAPVVYPRMLEAIRGARRSICFENYIVHGDDTGIAFLEALTERASAGVTVRVVYDWFGSLGTSRSFWKPLRAAGGEVRSFGPPSPLRPGTFLRRDHRKLMVVDGRVGVVGGLCVGDEWLNDHGLGCWRDTAVVVEGPVGHELERAFARMWRRAGGTMADPSSAPPEHAGDVAVRVVDGPPAHARAYRLYQLLAALAERSLYVTGAYPLAPSSLRRALASAARSGVDVRLLVPDRSDLRLLNGAARAHYSGLLRAGVRIYLWRGPMLHAKTLVVDGALGLVGSSNLNPFSLMGCYELDLELQGTRVAEQLEHQFLEDLERAEELHLEAWHHRTVGERLRERVGAAALWLPYKLYSG